MSAVLSEHPWMPICVTGGTLSLAKKVAGLERGRSVPRLLGEDGDEMHDVWL